MATLMLRLAAPIQSWGDESKYNIRHTWREPSKSGVIGMICSAMGIRRDSEDIVKLAKSLRMGIRIDQPGTTMVDFQTALAPLYSADGTARHGKDGSLLMDKAPDVTYRHYLCDACFLVGLESTDCNLLQNVAQALQHPVFPLFLGRRSCPPTGPIVLGIREESLVESLKNEEWQASEWYRRKTAAGKLHIICEASCADEVAIIRHDLPVSFSPIHRQFAFRSLAKEVITEKGKIEHDPMGEL